MTSSSTPLKPQLATFSDLSPELEYEIFATAARTDICNTPRLLLVAKRFHYWLEPILYEFLEFTSAARVTDFVEVALNRRAYLLESKIQIINFNVPAPCVAMAYILSVCKNVKKLACWSFRGYGYGMLIGSISCLQLARFESDVDTFLDLMGIPETNWYAGVTHLTLSNQHSHPRQSASLSRSIFARLTSLTHFAILFTPQDDELAAIKETLAESPSIEVLVLGIPPPLTSTSAPACFVWSHEVDDPRLVAIEVPAATTTISEDSEKPKAMRWERGFDWDSAEELVRSRRTRTNAGSILPI